MNKKEVLEIKRRFKKNECTFTKMTGCYVDNEKNIICKISETFLNLEEDEFYKYLEIAKKTLSGNIGNNLLEFEFPLEEEKVGGRQQNLMALRESGLKNEVILDAFYQHVIDNYDYAGNFLILLFHDAYDVIKKTKDNLKLDESEEVYEYIICALCPVSLSKPGLGYREDEHRIGPRIRDWVVGAPENGFVFPAFTDRSTDIHSCLYYTKNPKDTHPEFMEGGLGCPYKQTATEQKEAFQAIVHSALGGSEEQSSKVFMDIQENINAMVDEHIAVNSKDAEPMILTTDSIQEILLESGVPEEVTAKIEQSFTEEFGETPTVAEYLLDTKALAANAQKKKEQELVQQVQTLKQQLEEVAKPASAFAENSFDSDFTEEATLPDEESVSMQETAANENENDEFENSSIPYYDVFLKVKPEKVAQISSQLIDGKKCLIIPMDEDEHASVNGVNTVI